MSQLPSGLVSAILSQKAVCLVGAGFSLPAGMPTWGGLLSEIVDAYRADGGDETGIQNFLETVQELIASRRFEQAADLLEKEVTSGFISELVERVFDVNRLYEQTPERRNRMERRFEFLTNLPWAGIVTTNYDRLIEHAIESSRSKVGGTWAFSTTSLSKLGHLLNHRVGCRFFAKLHGSSEGVDYVLSTKSFEECYYADGRVLGFLTSLFLSYNFVFLGCSLTDQIAKLRESLMRKYDQNLPKSWAFVGKSVECEHISWLRRDCGINVIVYDDSADHVALDRCLMELVYEVSRFFEKRSIREKLMRMRRDDRLKGVGVLNESLVDIISLLPGRSLRHIDIVEGWNAIVDLVSEKERFYELRKVSADEIVYRLQFLSSLDLIGEYVDKDNWRVYSAL